MQGKVFSFFSPGYISSLTPHPHPAFSKWLLIKPIFFTEVFRKVALKKKKKKCKFCVENWLLWGNILTESAFLGGGQESLVLN